jgi:hypothetical protein
VCCGAGNNGCMTGFTCSGRAMGNPGMCVTATQPVDAGSAGQ